ncbi:PAS domain S-box-containing protein [Abditibacterium utsteinense]|uniref:histidine kinase n=1 Tax=Abditibacterium utsteinense TaxID=1960156 RepID=A0A2S8SRA9_9BACT|nr:PAS domain-containing hybrid sensor histidine kinase/response regulator [Abditibacterium utsteinense]PQV63330.1 PAS domain S-box-containing protein [Abditibacterium utsteinense]
MSASETPFFPSHLQDSARQNDVQAERLRVRGENPYRRQLEAVFNNATVALFILDERQQCVYLNPAAEQLTGFTLPEVQHKTLHDVIYHTRPDGSHFPREECAIDRAFPENSQQQGEEFFVHKDGSFYAVAFTASPIREGEKTVGTIIEVRGTAQEKQDERLVLGQAATALDNANLFESARRERARAESAYAQINDLLESITDSFFALDKDWRFTYINRNAESLLQRKPQDLIGKNVWEEYPEAVGGLFYTEYERAVKDQVAVIFNEFFAPVNKWFEVRAYPLQGGLSVFFHDVTEQKSFEKERTQLLAQERKAREEAEIANRTKDEFLATLSHELRTPLNAIIGWSSMISDSRLAEKEKAHGIEAIKRNALLQAQLIEDILDVSRIITGKLRLDVRAFELASVIEAAVESVSPAAQAKGIRLQRVLDSGTSLVSGDPSRLQQVIWNLLTNAIKFTPKDGRVQIRLERINSHVEIVVTDNGIGISADMLPHVFERFRQADSSSTRSFGGLGLGLAIVRHIIDMHGGTVEVESPGDGKGAIFTVKLPLMATRTVDAIPSDAIPGLSEERVHPTSSDFAKYHCPEELNGLHVLVVDDEEDARRLLKTVLESCNARVTTASNALEAFEVLQSFLPDVLISDLGMPGEDGYSLLRKVRALPPDQGGQIPAAALTAYARVEDRLQVLRSGFQIHLPKPVEPAELVAVVANLASRR